jgi:hypothetical protein
MIPQQGKPARVLDDEIEAVAVRHQKPPAVGGNVDKFFGNLDTAEMCSIVPAQELVVISWNVKKAGAVAALPQHFLDNIVVGLWPIPGRFELPAVDDVADQIDHVRFMKAEEIKQSLGLTASRSQMDIRYEESAKSPGGLHAYRVPSWICQAVCSRSRVVSQVCDVRTHGPSAKFVLHRGTL